MKKVMFLLLAALGSVLCNAQNITIIKTTDGKQYAVKTGNVEEQGFFEVESYSAPDTVIIHDTIYVDKIVEKIVHDTIYIENGSGTDPQPGTDPEVKVPYSHAVDLGLSVKWADMNVGAEKPEDCGWYLAWGETEEKATYDWSTYKWCNGSEDTMTKYCYNSNYGTVDNKTTLDPEDDAATVNWGGDWRMPTDAEMTELRSKCTYKVTSKNGISGYIVTGPNGNSIFLPTSGYRYKDSLKFVDTYGMYWSSSLFSPDAYHLLFYSNSVDRSTTSRSAGLSVRPVCPK